MRLRALLVALTLLVSSFTPAKSAELPPKIAVAYDIGFLGDNSFNDAVNVALKIAKKKFNLVEPFVREIPTNGSAVDRLSRLRFLAQNQYSLIIAVGASYREAVRRVSMEYPEVQFAIINDKSLGQMNISNIYFREDHGAYLAGLLAGLNTKTKSVGFIGSEPDLYAAYAQGVRAISKKIRVTNIPYPDNVADLKAALRNVDIGYATWDGDATVITTVLESFSKKVKLIVERPDQYFADFTATRGVLLASINKDLNKPINQLVSQAMKGRAIIDVIDENQGIYGREYGLQNGGVNYTLTKSNAAVQRLIASKIKAYLAAERLRQAG